MEWATIIASLIAAFFSLLAYFQSKKELYSNTISQNRLTWMQNIRLFTADYIAVVKDPESSIEMVQASQHKIELYLDPKQRRDTKDHSQKPFIDALHKCTKQFIERGDVNTEILVKEAQELMNYFWYLVMNEAKKGAQASESKNQPTDSSTAPSTAP